MCSVVYTLSDLFGACFSKNKKLYDSTIGCFGWRGMQWALLWCVQSGWISEINNLIFVKEVSPVFPDANILKETIISRNYKLFRLMLSHYKIDEDHPLVIEQLIEAVKFAEKRCQHETAIRILYQLENVMSEDILYEKFGYKVSESMKVYSRNKDYINATRYIKEKNYFQPIDTE